MNTYLYNVFDIGEILMTNIILHNIFYFREIMCMIT